MRDKVVFIFFIFGYKGLFLSRKSRSFIAKTSIHRAWLGGHMGIGFEKRNGVSMSVVDRDGVINRKKYKPSSFIEFYNAYREHYKAF